MLIIDHTYILSLKEFVDFNIKKKKVIDLKKNVIAPVLKLSNSERFIFYFFK